MWAVALLGDHGMGQIVKFRRHKKHGPWSKPDLHSSKGNGPRKFSLWNIAWPVIFASAAALIYIVFFSTNIVGEAVRYIKPAPAQPLIGRASVIDGDTIEIHGQRVRFNGIDAPESDQICRDGEDRPIRCGAKSAEFLDAFLKRSRPTRCEFVEWDSYGRFVGNCFRADGLSVSAAIVTAGHALDWPKYSGGKYAKYQEMAVSEKHGLWSGWFVVPWDYREQQRKKKSDQSDVSLFTSITNSGSCKIKGNISQNSGQKIYHVPGQKYYTQTRINPLFGERWFCSEIEAVSNGWRKSKI